jgi:hypothetical protein
VQETIKANVRSKQGVARAAPQAQPAPGEAKGP